MAQEPLPAPESPAVTPSPAPPLTAEMVGTWLRQGQDPKCEPRAVRIAERSAFVACGSAGLWFVRFPTDKAPEVVERRDLGGEVVGLFEREGRLWAEVLRFEAQPVATLGEDAGKVEPIDEPPPPSRPRPAQAAPAPAPAPAKKNRRHGVVVAVDADTAVIDFGAGDELYPGNRVEVLVPDGESIDPEQQSYSPIAVGKVIAVTESRARVQFGLNERIPIGALARVTRRSVTKGGAPPRLDRLWELSALAGPLITMDEAGAGLFLEAHAIYRFSRGAVGFAIEPFAFALAGPGAVTSFTTFGSISLDSTHFELGIGIGAQTVNDPDSGLEPGTGTVIPEFIRLGSRDGVHFAFRTDVVLFHSEFAFAAANATLQFPVADQSWLVARVGGGPTGYIFAELGLRALLHGNGDRGSSFLTVAAGWANIYEQSCDEAFVELGDLLGCSERDYEGPLLRVGLERRF